MNRRHWVGIGLFLGGLLFAGGLGGPLQPRPVAGAGVVEAPWRRVGPGGPAEAAGCPPAWQIVPSPNLGPGPNYLVDVAAVAPNDIWAVGIAVQAPLVTQALIEHWDGAAWSIVPAPNPGPGAGALSTVVALGAGDVWVGGYYENVMSGQTEILVLHWDGATWSRVATPNPGALGNQFIGLGALAPNDIWAVGQNTAGIFRPLIEHWDGSVWSVVPSPIIMGDPALLYNVVAVAPNDVWALGGGPGANPNTPALIEHWDGSAWSIVPGAPPGPVADELYGGAALAPNDIWAVGASYGSAPGTARIEHWDGTAWSIVPAPAGVGWLYDVQALAPNDVWAVGRANQGPGAVVLHWDGSAWSIVPSPQPGSRWATLVGLAILNPTDIWAVGYRDLNTGDTLTEHYAPVCSTGTPSPTATPGATQTPRPTPTGRPRSDTPAELCLSLRQDPDQAVAPGDIFTYTVQLGNAGPGAAGDPGVRLPLDPNVEVLDFHSARPGIFVDYVGDDAVSVRFPALAPGQTEAAQIIARVRPGAPVGTAITSRAVAAWSDSQPRSTRRSNAVTILVGPTKDSGAHGLLQPLRGLPADPVATGAPLALSGDFFGEAEPVSVWVHLPDGRDLPRGAPGRSDATGLATFALDTADLPAGPVLVVAHGWCTGVEGVGTITLR